MQCRFIKPYLLSRSAVDHMSLRLQRITLDEHYTRLYGPTVIAAAAYQNCREGDRERSPMTSSEKRREKKALSEAFRQHTIKGWADVGDDDDGAEDDVFEEHAPRHQTEERRKKQHYDADSSAATRRQRLQRQRSKEVQRLTMRLRRDEEDEAAWMMRHAPGGGRPEWEGGPGRSESRRLQSLGAMEMKTMYAETKERLRHGR